VDFLPIAPEWTDEFVAPPQNFYECGFCLQLKRPLLCYEVKDRRQPHLRRTHMNTLSSKLGAFAAALAMNGLIMTGLIYLFALQAHPNLSAISFASAVAAHQWQI
jgi:hypothetical protein